MISIFFFLVLWNLCQQSNFFQEDWLADSFNVFLDYSMQLIRKYRKLFPPYHHISMNRLEYILR